MNRRTGIAAQASIYLFLSFGSIVCLLPFYWMLRSSLMSLDQIFVSPPIWIPHALHFANYVAALTMFPFAVYFVNTLTVVLLSVLGVVLTSSLWCLQLRTPLMAGPRPLVCADTDKLDAAGRGHAHPDFFGLAGSGRD